MAKIAVYPHDPVAMTSGGVFPYSDELRNSYTFQSKYGDPIKLYKVQGNNILLPRGLTIEGGHDRRVSGSDINVTDHFKARSPEQDRVVDEVTALLKSGVSHICECPTGFGKTIVGAAAIARIGKKALVIVTKDDIKSQWVAAFQTVMKLKKSDIGLIQGDKMDVAGKPIVIAMVHSVCKDGRYPSWIYKEFGLVVIDEVHRMGAETFGEAIWMFPAKLRLGLSASPNRKDGKDILFKSHIGPVRVRSDAYPLIPKVMTFTHQSKMPKMAVQAGRTAHIDRILSRDSHRNRIIAGFMTTAWNKGRNPVFFSSRVDHLQTIHDMLVGRGVPQKNIGFYVGGLTDEQRDVAKRKDVVLATYQMASEATDAPWWDVAVLGTPRSDVLQIVGRVLREYEGKCNTGEEGGGKKAPIVLDIEDVKPTLFRKYAQKRRVYYGKLGAPIQRISVENFL